MQPDHVPAKPHSSSLVDGLDNAVTAAGNYAEHHPWLAAAALAAWGPAGAAVAGAEVGAKPVNPMAAPGAHGETTQPGADHTNAHVLNAKPPILPHVELHGHDSVVSAPGHSGDNGLSHLLSDPANAMRNSWSELTKHPEQMLAMGTVGSLLYDGYEIHKHGGLGQIIPGTAAVLQDLATGSGNEVTHHPDHMLEAGIGGAVVAGLVKVPYLGPAVIGAGALYAGYEVYKHGGEWMHDAAVIYDQRGHSQAEIAGAHSGLQQDGGGLALVGAGGIGAGVSSVAVGRIGSMLAGAAEAQVARAGSAAASRTAADMLLRNAGGRGPAPQTPVESSMARPVVVAEPAKQAVLPQTAPARVSAEQPAAPAAHADKPGNTEATARPGAESEGILARADFSRMGIRAYNRLMAEIDKKVVDMVTGRPLGQVGTATEKRRMPPRVLSELATNADEDVRFFVANHESTKPDTLAALAGDTAAAVRTSVASNHATSENTLRMLASDSSTDVSNAARRALGDRARFPQ